MAAVALGHYPNLVVWQEEKGVLQGYFPFFFNYPKGESSAKG